MKTCITDFKAAGCKVWILTGDKDATANQIGISCGVLSANKQTIQIETVDETIDGSQWRGKDILISGQAINRLLEMKAEGKNLVDSILDIEGLVVYRSSPAQKARIVSFVRSMRRKQTTLSIGDGANDVNMIESAHVGIGIMGKEGNQAASFSDFAINQYSDLRQLMFWHGNNWLVKLFTFTLLTVTKTSVFGLAGLFYQFSAFYSGVNYTSD